MSAKNNSTKLNIPMVLACVLLCATLLSIHMTSGLYSRYTSSGSGTDSARVIKFGDITLTETGDFLSSSTDAEGNQTNKVVVAPGVTIKKSLKVSFEGSEAATYVFVTVTPTDNKWIYDNSSRQFYIGTGTVNWSVTDGWIYHTKDSATWVFYKALNPGDVLENNEFIKDGIKVSKTAEASSINSINETSFTFQAKVVQANGFDSVAAAWTSVSTK